MQLYIPIYSAWSCLAGLLPTRSGALPDHCFPRPALSIRRFYAEETNTGMEASTRHYSAKYGSDAGGDPSNGTGLRRVFWGDGGIICS